MGVPSSFAIEHVTRYNYASPVIGCVMSLCLKPRDDAGQRLLAFDIKTDPPAPVNEEQRQLRQHEARAQRPPGT